MKKIFLALLLLASPAFAQKPAIKAADVPAFQARFRVASIEGQVPVEGRKFGFSNPRLKLNKKITGSEWTEWVDFSKEQMETIFR